MWRVLIVYGTVNGQSEKIANRIAEVLIRMGHTVDVFNGAEIYPDVDPKNYDAFIAGAGVHISGFPKAFKKWIARHAVEINKKPSAFFSVCLGILQKEESVQNKEREIVESFFESSGWTPNTWTIFAGALKYSQYNWLLKRIMRTIARKAGSDTDIHRDYEFTDWARVEDFAKQCHDLVVATGYKESATKLQ